VGNRDKFMKNKEHKNLEETQKTRSNVIFFGKSLVLHCVCMSREISRIWEEWVHAM